MNQPLRAKSASDCTVLQHCRQVRHTAEVLWESIESDLAAATGMAVSELREQVRPLMLAAALLHDLGKINSAFQAMLDAKPGSGIKQPVRHEILSGWLLADPDFFGPWFARLRPEGEVWPVIWAVTGHHLKMGDPAAAVLFERGSGTKEVAVPLSAADVDELLREVAEVLGSDLSPPRLSDVYFQTADAGRDGLERRITRFATLSCSTWERLEAAPEVAQRTALLKALLIAADVGGSALTGDETAPAQWIPEALSHRLHASALGDVIHRGTKGGQPLPFQAAVGESSAPATVVIAGCGNGKTTAAYLWAKRHAQGRKLWFTYPTTGTASAGFQGYLLDHPDLLTTLIHGRAEVDLRAMAGTGEDAPGDEAQRLESLQAWDRQAIVCTVDTVLGLMQNRKRPLFSFPAIAAGAFVFDEIHSYDGRLFGALLRFLRTFPGVPVLLMSASIPPGRMEALRRVMGDRMGPPIHGDPALEGYRRYRLARRSSAEHCRDEARNALSEGKKVLWVCNRVSDAIEVARSARRWAGIPPEAIIVYHSRFRYRDRAGDEHRKGRQREVIEAFAYRQDGSRPGPRKHPGGCLVVTTQVCEMSLDISADLLVTAECPLPSLVQRLGRLNRYAASDDPWPCLVYPFQGKPYDEQEDAYRIGMTACREAVSALAGQPCSQRDLADFLARMAEQERIENYSAWLQDGWLAEPAQLRDGDSGITLIREEDLPEIERELGPEHARPSKWTFRRLVPWTIPMLSRRGFKPVRRAGGYPVAARGTVAYSLEEGAQWQKSMN